MQSKKLKENAVPILPLNIFYTSLLLFFIIIKVCQNRSLVSGAYYIENAQNYRIIIIWRDKSCKRGYIRYTIRVHWSADKKPISDIQIVHDIVDKYLLF